MTLLPRLVAASLAAFTLAACAGSETAPASMRGEYVQDAAARVKAADWSRVTTVVVRLASYTFTPQDVSFRVGQPYRLRLRNVGGSKHNFAAPEFFKAIAVQKVATEKGDNNNPHWLKVALGGNEQKDVYFVAVKTGTYALECSVLGHATFGMTGKIRIVR